MKIKLLFVLFFTCFVYHTSLAMMKMKMERKKGGTLVFEPVSKKYDTVFSVLLRLCTNGDMENLKKFKRKYISVEIARHFCGFARLKGYEQIAKYFEENYEF